MRRAAMVVVAIAMLPVILSGCGGSTAELGSGDIARLALARADAPRRFEAVSEHGGSTLVVRGVVADDYRYRASVEADGRMLWEEVDIDDRRWVRIEPASGNSLFPPQVAGRVLALHPAFTELLSGRWVLDPEGVPADVNDGRARPVTGPLSPHLVLDRVRVLESLPALAAESFSGYDPEGIEYLRRNDRFPPHPEDGTRFDHLPRAYDPNSTTVTLSSLRPMFEWDAVWLTPDGVTRVERLLELPDPADSRYRSVYDQIRRAGSDRLRKLVGGRRAAVVRESLVFGPPGAEEVVPPADAVDADVTAALTAMQPHLGDLPPTPLFGPVE